MTDAAKPSSRFLLSLALGLYFIMFIGVKAIVSTTMSSWLEGIAGWPPPIEPRLDAYLMNIPQISYRPVWIGMVLVTTSGIVALPLTLVALRLLVGGQKHE